MLNELALLIIWIIALQSITSGGNPQSNQKYFVMILNDKQKLTKKSFTIARKFDNSILEDKGKGFRVLKENLSLQIFKILQ